MTNELRKLVVSRLKTVTSNVYYRVADTNAIYPHVVFSFEDDTIRNDDLNRHDYRMIVDVWDKKNASQAEILSDQIAKLLNGVNLPQTSIVPTFYLERRGWVLDEDKAISHIQLKFIIQNYER